MTPEQKRLDKYYLKKFGWSLSEVDALFASQGNVCAACGRPPGERRMSLDHDHAYDRVKIIVSKFGSQGWFAEGNFEGQHCYDVQPTRKLAREVVRRMLRRLSVRAGLCLRCNKGLAMFEDSKAPLPPAERLERLAQVLRRFQGKSHEAISDNSPSSPVVSSSDLASNGENGHQHQQSV